MFGNNLHYLLPLAIIDYSTSSREVNIRKAKDIGVSYFIKPNVIDELRIKLETVSSSPLPLHLDIN